MNHVTLFERDAYNVTADPGSNVHQIYGSGSAGKLAPVDDLFLHRFADGHIGREEGELTFRRINPQADWVELFEQCPVPMDDLPPRSREYPKKLRL